MLDLAGVFVFFLFIKSSGCLLFSLKMFPLPEQCVQERRAVASRGHGRQGLRGCSLQNKTAFSEKATSQSKPGRDFGPLAEIVVCYFSHKKTKNTSYDTQGVLNGERKAGDGDAGEGRGGCEP